MSMRTDMFIKSFRADAAIVKHRIAKAGAADASTAQAAAATDAIIGVNGSLDAVAGQVTDLVVGGYATVQYGGTVTRGAPLTSDAQGRAIVATAAGQRLIGFAVIAGVVGDFGTVDIRLGFMATAGA